MTWAELTLKIRYLLDQGVIDGANIEEGAFDELARLLRLFMPEVIAQPERILNFDKGLVIEKLNTRQGLNAALLFALDVVYAVLGWDDEVVVPENMPKPTPKMPKLKSLADRLSKIFEQFFNCHVSYHFETQPEWLKSVPDHYVYEAVWEDISDVYAVLVDHRWTLSERLREYKEQMRGGRQRVDIWFDEPINCMVEFDETQHFNQFRLNTLQTWRGYAQCSFDFKQYLALANATTIPAGTTPFQCLKRFDPLFPPMLDGEAQDNRIRQRAFRDFLKDITPLIMPNVNPTIRISYRVTNGRIRDFTPEDLEAVGTYIQSHEILERIQLG